MLCVFASVATPTDYISTRRPLTLNPRRTTTRKRPQLVERRHRRVPWKGRSRHGAPIVVIRRAHLRSVVARTFAFGCGIADPAAKSRWNFTTRTRTCIASRACVIRPAVTTGDIAAEASAVTNKNTNSLEPSGQMAGHSRRNGTSGAPSDNGGPVTFRICENSDPGNGHQADMPTCGY